MPKRLILCFDGEWTTNHDGPEREHSVFGGGVSMLHPDPARDFTETNVEKLYRSLLARSHDGWPQQRWYSSGSGWARPIKSGRFGRGLDQTILQGYLYLAATYEEGDEMYLYGFSRGAYIARSVAGLIRNCGLVRRETLHRSDLVALDTVLPAPTMSDHASADVEAALTATLGNPANHLLDEAYRIYRERDHNADTQTAVTFRKRYAREIPITLLGAWDTVGALGIPFQALKQLGDHKYNFHDTDLSHIVQHAYHAVALDEHREDYKATLWTSAPKHGQVIEQCWFPGSHGDVGGAYRNHALGDLSLAWMQRKSQQAGLALDLKAGATMANPLGPAHDSFGETFPGVWKWFQPRFYRPVMQSGAGTEVLDESVRIRVQQVPAYHPRNDGITFLRHS